jgi:hypothetical protein
MYGQMHQKIIDALAKISSRPIRFLVNTHLHGDHTGGNQAMARLGAVLISHENMRKQMAAQTANPPSAAALPALTYTDRIRLHFDGEDIEIYHPAPAHTDGDSIVYFRRANVMHVRDVPSSRVSQYRRQRRRFCRWHWRGARVMNIANGHQDHPGHLDPSGSKRSISSSRCSPPFANEC